MKIELGRVLYALPGLVWTALPSGRIDFVNRYWVEYTGLGLDEAHGGEWREIVHQDDMPALREWWSSMSSSLEPAETEVRLCRFDGLHRRFLIRCAPMFDDVGRVERWCGVCTDVDDLRGATDVSAKQCGDFQPAGDSIPIPVAALDAKGKPELINRQMRDDTRKTEEELETCGGDDLVAPAGRAAAAEALKAGVSSGPALDIVYRIESLADEDGNIVNRRGINTDIDAQKRAEAVSREAERGVRDIIQRRLTASSTAGRLRSEGLTDNESPLVTIVDDDESVRESLPDLVKEFGYRVEAFASGASFLVSGVAGWTDCLILDVAMPGMTGPELLRELRGRSQNIPVVFITAHRDELVRRQLLADGAVDCLYKPFSDAALQGALESALRPA